MPKRRVTVAMNHAADSEDEEESSGEQHIYEDGEYDDDEDFDSSKPEPSNLKMNGTSVRRKSRIQHVTFSRSKSSSKTRSNSKNSKKVTPSLSSSEESDDDDSETFVQPKTQTQKRLNGKHVISDNNNLNGSNHTDNPKSKQRNSNYLSSNSERRKGRSTHSKESTIENSIVLSDSEEPPPTKNTTQKSKTKSKTKLLPLYNSSDGESSSKSLASLEKQSSHENGNNISLDQSGEMLIDDNNTMDSLEEYVDTDNSVEHNKILAKDKLRRNAGKKLNGLRVRKAVANKLNVKLTSSTSDIGPQSDKSDPPSRRTSRTTIKQPEDEPTNGSSSEPSNSHRVSPVRTTIRENAMDENLSDSEIVQQHDSNDEPDDQSGADDDTSFAPPPKFGKNREKTKRKKVMAKKPAKKKVVQAPSPQKKRKLFDPPSNLLEDIVFEGVEDDESDEDMDMSQSFSLSSQNEDVNGLTQSIKDNLVVKTDISDAEEISSPSLKSSSEIDKLQTSQFMYSNQTQPNEVSLQQQIPGSPSEPHRNGITNGMAANNSTFKKQPSFRLQLPNMSIKVYCDDKNKS